MQSSSSEKRASVQLSIKQNSHFRWLCTKAWKPLIKTKVCSQNSRKWKSDVWKPYRNLNWLDKLQFSIQSFFEQFSTENYYVTDQTSITRSRRSVLNFKFSVLTFFRSMSCSMSIEQKLCEVELFQLQSMSNAIRCSAITAIALRLTFCTLKSS